jgi:uncharacterized protein
MTSRPPLPAEPRAPEGTRPRYSSRPFPAYRYRPGATPHPRRDAGGHSRGEPDPRADPWHARQWATLETWLFGVDLFNHAFWWECHEQLEALWLAAGRTSVHAGFVQGLIKIAAACLNSSLGKHDVGAGQASAGTAAMRSVARTAGDPYMGVHVETFTTDVDAWFHAPAGDVPVLRLDTDAR